jgi:hypothetical protein
LHDAQPFSYKLIIHMHAHHTRAISHPTIFSQSDIDIIKTHFGGVKCKYKEIHGHDIIAQLIP